MVVPTLQPETVPPALEVSSLKWNLNESNVKQMSVSTTTLLVGLLFYCGFCGGLPVRGCSTVVRDQLTGGFTVVSVVGYQ